MACIEARGLRKAFGTTDRAGRHRSARRRRPHPRTDRPQRRGQDAPRSTRFSVSPPTKDELKVLGRDPWSARDQLMRDVCFHRRRRGAAALDAGFASARLRRRACIRDSIARRRKVFWRGPRSSARARSGNYRKAWSRSCISRWSWRSTRNCSCWTSRRLASTSCIASNSTIRC